MCFNHINIANIFKMKLWARVRVYMRGKLRLQDRTRFSAIGRGRPGRVKAHAVRSILALARVSTLRAVRAHLMAAKTFRPT